MTPPRMIAVGYDGSLDASRALQWAFGLAATINCDATVVFAAGLLERVEPTFERATAPEEVQELARECGVEPSRLHWRVEDGDPCSVLLRSTAPPVEADLLVVGTRGQGQHPGLLLGSTSLELAHRTTTPLVIVPSPVPPASE